ncbi:MAG TPA: ABC transporter ATP-binding protein [Deinococcales bacterium]|nr:ABC transporter ATP-binding protein [Deinococcales bacterium]
MGFVMDGLSGESYDRSYSDRELLSRIFAWFRPWGRHLLGVALLIVSNAAMLALIPILTARVIDLVGDAGLGTRAAFTAALPLLSFMLAAAFLAWLFNFFRQRLTARVVGEVVLTIRAEAFDAVLAHDLSFYDEYSTGRIVSRVTTDTHDFTNVVTLVLNLLSQLLIVFIILVVLLGINFRLALITLAVAPLIIGAALAFRVIARRTSLQAKRVIAEVNANIQESLTGIGVAKTFRQEAALHDDFSRVNAEAYRLRLRQGLVLQVIFPVLAVIAGFGTVIVVWFGGLDVIGGRLSTGEWFLFAEGLALFWFPLTSIASFWSQFQDGLAASERIFALMDAEPRVHQSGTVDPGTPAGAISFRNVTFAYRPEEPVLREFSLDICAGETVALVGHTGAGKSSLGRLIARFYEFQEGSLEVDGHDIRSFDLAAWRRNLGIVQQTPFLFSGTVLDNVRYGAPEKTPEQVRAAARAVAGGDWLAALPNELDTELAEGGRGISMGQRQLVALARILLKDPAVVILDEATASIDPLTEAHIQEGLETVLGQRTAIVIAHRLSTVRMADRIIVLDHGRIIEEGSHDALLAAGGHYRSLYDTYFRHQDPDYEPDAAA